MFPIKQRENLENLNELVSLQNQVKSVRLQYKLGKQNIHEDLKQIFESITKSIENISQNKIKTMTETSTKNNQAIENSINKLLKITNDRGILATYLMSPLSKFTNPYNISQFKLVKDQNSNRVFDLLIHKSIPITLYNNLLTCRDTGREFDLKGDLLELITNKDYNVDLAEYQTEI